MLYALLIYSRGPDGHASPDPAETERILGRHKALLAETRAAGTLAGCVRLAPTTAARTVRQTERGAMVTDGPFAETKEWLAGLYVVDCADDAEAVRHAETICCSPGDRIELRPVSWVPPEFSR